MRRASTALWVMVGLLGCVVAAVAVYKAWPLLFPAVALEAPVDPQCDLRVGACTTIVVGGGRVTFAIEPRSLPVMTPLQLQVELAGVDAMEVEVDFSGVDMNMGFNRPRLQPLGGGRFAGETTLPVCVRSSMEWEARVLVQRRGGLLAVPFRFETGRR